MFELLFTKVLVIHIISVMIAVGTVTVTDYLHILGLRNPKLERQTLFVFPHLSNLIRLALLAIYITGTMMVLARPEILSSPLFWVKLTLVGIVTVNGFILHHVIFPRIEKGIKKKQYSTQLIRIAAFGGSLSVISWYGIVVLALTKNVGYTPLTFILFYILAAAIAYIVAVHIETQKIK